MANSKKTSNLFDSIKNIFKTGEDKAEESKLNVEKQASQSIGDDFQSFALRRAKRQCKMAGVAFDD